MNPSRYEVVFVNGVWVVRDRQVWKHTVVAPQTRQRAEEVKTAKETK